MKDGQFIGFNRKVPWNLLIEVIEKRFHNASTQFQAECIWLGYKFTGPERTTEFSAVRALLDEVARDLEKTEGMSEIAEIAEIITSNGSDPMMVEVAANTLDEAMHVIESKFREGYEAADINLRKAESTLIPGQGWSRIFTFSVRAKQKCEHDWEDDIIEERDTDGTVTGKDYVKVCGRCREIQPG